MKLLKALSILVREESTTFPKWQVTLGVTLYLFLKSCIYFLNIYYSCNGNAARYFYSTLSSEHSGWAASSVFMNFIVRTTIELTFAFFEQMREQAQRNERSFSKSQNKSAESAHGEACSHQCRSALIVQFLLQISRAMSFRHFFFFFHCSLINFYLWRVVCGIETHTLHYK